MRSFIYAIGVCSLLFSCNSELETLPEEFNTEGTAPLVTRVAAHPKYGRSVEHTSELQSHA